MSAKHVLALATAGLVFGAASAQAAEAVSLRFATVGIGSAWYAYGAGIADIIKSKLPAGSSVDVLPIAGGKAALLPQLLQSTTTTRRYRWSCSSLKTVNNVRGRYS